MRLIMPLSSSDIKFEERALFRNNGSALTRTSRPEMFVVRGSWELGA